MKHWQQARTALFVLRHGTISTAAEEMQVHRATVIRHIDELELALNTKLFQRHGRGYTPTEAGLKFRQAAEATEQRFSQFTQELEHQQLSGAFIITSLPGLDDLIMPALVDFQKQHPLIDIQLHASERLFQMESGEAHVAIRAGQAPQDPDNVVIPLTGIDSAIYAHPDYLQEFGTPKNLEELKQHRFIGLEKNYLRVPFMAWLQQQDLLDNIHFQTRSTSSIISAVRNSAGLAFLPSIQARQHSELVEVMPPRAEWQSNCWIVTHKDLHHTTKVQTFLNVLNQHLRFRH